MEEKQISFAAFEAMVATNERHIKRLLFALLLAVILLFASNIAWLHFFGQFDFSGDYAEDIYTQEGEGRFNLNVGEQGDVTYGETDLSESPPELPNDAP